MRFLASPRRDCNLGAGKEMISKTESEGRTALHIGNGRGGKGHLKRGCECFVTATRKYNYVKSRDGFH